MTLLLDTKPRFRAEHKQTGPMGLWRVSAKGLYKHWSKGPLLPNSVAVNLELTHPLRGLFKNGHQPGEIAVVQSGKPEHRRKMLAIVREFLEWNKKGRERLIVVDEGLDFYLRNSLGIDPRNDVILDSARAGGERNVGLLFCAHRPHGVPPLLNTLSSRVILYHLRFEHDMRYLWHMGIPTDDLSPEGDYVFNHYTIQRGGTVSSPTVGRLALPQWYLDQLAST
jgi:hypothetical protein